MQLEILAYVIKYDSLLIKVKKIKALWAFKDMFQDFLGKEFLKICQAKAVDIIKMHFIGITIISNPEYLYKQVILIRV